MSIDPSQKRDQDTGVKLLTLLHGLTRALVLYETNNDTVVRLVEDLWRTIDGYFKAGASELKIQLLEDEAFVNGQLIRMDAQLYERTTDLSKSLQTYEIGEVHFESTVTKQQCSAFLKDLSTSLRSPAETVEKYFTYSDTTDYRVCGQDSQIESVCVALLDLPDAGGGDADDVGDVGMGGADDGGATSGGDVGAPRPAPASSCECTVGGGGDGLGRWLMAAAVLGRSR